jgi:hypothetical protein
VVLGEEEIHAACDRLSYDDESRRLVLYGNVRLGWRRQGQQSKQVDGQKVVIDRRTRTFQVEGPGSIGLAVPMLGPVPIALSFGFPDLEEQHERQQVFNFFLGFTR